MSKITSDFETFLSANYPNDYKKITGSNVEESLITTILSRYESKYFIWKQIPDWVKTLFHNEIPHEVFVGHEPYTNFVTFLTTHHNDYIRLNDIVFSTALTNEDSVAFCCDMADKGYSIESAILLSDNRNTRKELLEKGLQNTEEGKSIWFETRQKDIEIVKDSFKDEQLEKYALNILIKQENTKEQIEEREEKISALQAQLAIEEDKEKKAELEEKIKKEEEKIAKAKAQLENMPEEDRKWMEENKEIVAKVSAKIEETKEKGYSSPRAKVLIADKMERERLSKQDKPLSDGQKKLWQETRKKDIEAIKYEWKKNHPEKYALHLLKEYFRASANNKETTQGSNSKNENPPSQEADKTKTNKTTILEEYNEFTNSQPEPLRSALQKTANAIIQNRESSKDNSNSKEALSSQQLMQLLHKHMTSKQTN